MQSACHHTELTAHINSQSLSSIGSSPLDDLWCDRLGDRRFGDEDDDGDDDDDDDADDDDDDDDRVTLFRSPPAADERPVSLLSFVELEVSWRRRLLFVLTTALTVRFRELLLIADTL